MISRLIKILMLLLIGAILTFAVSSVCSIFSQRNYYGTWPGDTSQVWWADPKFIAKPDPGCYQTSCFNGGSLITFPWQTEEKKPQRCNRGYVIITLQGFGVTEQHSLGSHFHNNGNAVEHLKYKAIQIDAFVREIYVPYITDFRETINEIAALLSWKEEILLQTGWPFKAFSGIQVVKYGKESSGLELANGCLVVSTRLNEAEDPWIIPVRLLWSGLTANTLLYAGTIWALLYAPGTLKSWVRRRKRQCHCCGYPIGASEVCTECGTTLNRSSIERAIARRPEAARLL